MYVSRRAVRRNWVVWTLRTLNLRNVTYVSRWVELVSVEVVFVSVGALVGHRLNERRACSRGSQPTVQGSPSG